MNGQTTVIHPSGQDYHTIADTPSHTTQGFVHPVANSSAWSRIKTGMKQAILDYSLAGVVIWVHSNVETLKEHVLNFLSNKANEHGVQTPRGVAIQLDFTQGDIATLIGLSRAEATRAINALKSEGTIAIEGATIFLRDLS